MATLPPTDPLMNLAELFFFIVKNVLKAYPIIVGVLTLILFAIITFLLFLFQGIGFMTP